MSDGDPQPPAVRKTPNFSPWLAKVWRKVSGTATRMAWMEQHLDGSEACATHQCGTFWESSRIIICSYKVFFIFSSTLVELMDVIESLWNMRWPATICRECRRRNILTKHPTASMHVLAKLVRWFCEASEEWLEEQLHAYKAWTSFCAFPVETLVGHIICAFKINLKLHVERERKTWTTAWWVICRLLTLHIVAGQSHSWNPESPAGTAIPRGQIWALSRSGDGLLMVYVYDSFVWFWLCCFRLWFHVTRCAIDPHA